MRFHSALKALCVFAVAAAPGCTSLKEIPRGEYASLPERRNVRLVTNDGLEYEFDFARFTADSVTGYRRQDIEGIVEEYTSFQLPYGEVSKLAMRRVDWYRTGLIGGGVLAAVVAAGLSATGDEAIDPGGGGGGGRPPGIP